ncbi:hypothetical protein GGF46_004147 [Coemansia sp. RSA 552]|nr:hypothetical protein GGF46_004147 [Coemansia sp. RSA 552]
MPIVPPFVASGPYDRPLPQAMSLASGGAGSSSFGPASMRHAGQQVLSQLPQNPHLTQQQQQQQSVFAFASGRQNHGMPPPPPPSQMRPPLQPQINSLGAGIESGGPVSLHLKRDPGFGQDMSEEGGIYDPAKQAAEMSQFYLLPMNSFHTSCPQNNLGMPLPYGSQPGPSSSRHRDALDGAGGPLNAMPDISNGNGPYVQRTPSLSSNGGRGARGDSLGREPMAGMPPGFDPMALAQDLSSAYVSAIAGMSPQNSMRADSAGQVPLSAPVRPSNAPGKSASHTPIDGGSRCSSSDLAGSAKMRDLRRRIRSIISSVWADTECGRSAGMAGVTMADEDDEHGGRDMRSPNTRHGCNGTATGELAAGVSLASPSGDRSMDDHLLNVFFEYVHHQLPIIKRSTFHAAYSQGQVSPMLVCAMCAAAAVFLNRIEDERTAICDRYSRKVRALFHDACFEPNLEVVQTALIMTLCEYRQGCLHRAWVYLSMGFRLAIAMGYHHLDARLRSGPVQTSADIAHRETCRRAFWGAFLLDRYTAIGGGKALGINDDDISVLLPLRGEDWQSQDAAPPASVLEFFRPLDARISRAISMSDSDGAFGAATAIVSEPATSVLRRDSSLDISTSSPLTGSSTDSRKDTPSLSTEGSGGRTGDVSVLAHFIKLMTVVGQVAQYINGSKGVHSEHQRPEHQSRDHSVLDAALLRWKEELPPSLSYAEAQSMSASPEQSVFVMCMYAVYYGAVIMLNRENMGLLRGLPGQLDVSTNLAIRALERCRVAAMEIVEITHHICSLPAAMTNALLPWALFQAGTLLVHFMIAGSTAQAQEEARSAILSLDCALRDELSRYWNVSSKYHLVLCTMVKAWERARQTTPRMTPRLPATTPASAMAAAQQPSVSMQAQVGPALTGSAADTYQALNAQLQPSMQMQMHMQLPSSSLAPPQQPPAGDAFTLLKPFSGRGEQSAQTSLAQLRQSSLHSSSSGAKQGSLESVTGGDPSLMPNFMFTAHTAQDSLNTLNEFLSQLSQEQVRQVSKGMQSYALQGGRTDNLSAAASASTSKEAAHSLRGNPMLASDMRPQQKRQVVSLTNAALQHIQSMAGLELGGHQQGGRDSIPISSSGDLFTAPGLACSSSSAADAGAGPHASLSLAQTGSDSMMNPELDPFLFHPMTPFLQELQLFGSPSAQMPAVPSSMPGSSSLNTSNGQSHS